MPRQKKVDDEEKEGAEIGGDSESSMEENGSDVQPKEKGGVTKVIFHIRNPNVPSGQSVRVFDRANHGADFTAVADEFETANTLKKPLNLQDSKEVDECVAFNRNIKHNILSRVNE